MNAMSPFSGPNTVGERMWADEICKIGWDLLVSNPTEKLPEFGRNLINRINLLEDLHRVELAQVKSGEIPCPTIVDPIATRNIQHCRANKCE